MLREYYDYYCDDMGFLDNKLYILYSKLIKNVIDNYFWEKYSLYCHHFPEILNARFLERMIDYADLENLRIIKVILLDNEYACKNYSYLLNHNAQKVYK